MSAEFALALQTAKASAEILIRLGVNRTAVAVAMMNCGLTTAMPQLTEGEANNYLNAFWRMVVADTDAALKAMAAASAATLEKTNETPPPGSGISRVGLSLVVNRDVGRATNEAL